MPRRKTSPIWKILLKLDQESSTEKHPPVPMFELHPWLSVTEISRVSLFHALTFHHPDKRHGLFWQYRARWVVDWSTRTALFGGFLKWWYPTTMGFPTKKWSFWGVLGVPPFKETPIYCKKNSGPWSNGNSINQQKLSNSFGLLYQLYLLRIIPTFFRGHLRTKSKTVVPSLISRKDQLEKNDWISL